jgi:hypothetical protein
MFIICAMILGLILGAVRGGSVRRIFSKKIALWPLGLIGIALQLGLHLWFYGGAATGVATIINFVSYLLILVTLIFNFDDLWAILMTVGTTANFIASFINGGKMPVASNIVQALGNHQLITSISNGTNAVYNVMSQSTTTLWMLGINVPIPYLGRVTGFYGGVGGFSIGSVLTFVGIVGWIQYKMNVQPAAEDSFLDDTEFGTEDYIFAPDEMDYLPNKEKTGYETEPLDWLQDNSAELFTMEEADHSSEPAEAAHAAKEADAPMAEEAMEKAPETDAPEATAVLPDLSPELLNQIRSHGQKNVIKAPEPETDSDDTRVFTTLKDLGRYDTRPIGVEKEPMHSARDEEDDFAESGFFTQSFYAEREKGRLAFGDVKAEPASEQTAPKKQSVVAEASVLPDIQPQIIEEEDQMSDQHQEPTYFRQDRLFEEDEVIEETSTGAEQKRPSWQPVEKAANPKRTREQKINPYRKYSNEQAAQMTDASRDNEKQMLSVWQQVSKETEALRQRGKRTSEYLRDAENPFHSSEEERQRLKKEHNRARGRAPEEPATSPSDRAKTQKAPQEASADAEREKAGFEKVEINVEGRTVSFWRKKKETAE